MKALTASLPAAILLTAVTPSGGSPDFTGIMRNTDGTMRLEMETRADSYYIVWRNTAADLSAVWTPEAVTAGTGAVQTLYSSTSAAPRGFYKVEEVALTETTRDTDGDGLADVYEILYPAVLNGAVNDATGNPDNDARNNLDEFLAGTHPGIPQTITGLVINEVEYDQPGTDSSEYVEILNTSADPIPLHGIHLALINGANNTEYLRVNLGAAGTLAGGQYLVVKASTVNIPANALGINFVSATNNIQNGAPDGLGLITPANQGLLDALSYEGAITAAQFSGFSQTLNLVEGTALPGTVQESGSIINCLSRLPNGTDTNNSATDWALSVTNTPGAANVP
jgi:Lamin Tail Domain